ncbi:MAG: hypothetical protein C0605_03345 [Hyphomicrobiales bacterium]|nr:MAG: hypothetical protein C0605_03345 [Hyphomicrobiales bacterium]
MQVDAPIVPRRRLSMTPLIDVVFLLLVFFMLASTFAQYSRIDVTGSRPGRAASAIAGSQYVRVHQDGRIDLNGAPVSLSALTAGLARPGGAGGVKVIVRPGEGANVQHLVTALEAIRAAAPDQIILAR